MDLDEVTAPYIRKNSLPGHGEAFAAVMRHMTNPDTRIRYNTLRRMPRITAPTLVCWGTDDQTNAFEMGEQTAAAIPGARLVPFEGVGHMLPQQAADRFNEVVLEFLAS